MILPDLFANVESPLANTPNSWADLWHDCAQISRAEIFGARDALRPVYDNNGVISTQIDTPAVGMVGPNYARRRVAIVSVNPAGGSPRSASTDNDRKLYELFKQIRDEQSPHPSTFEALNAQFMACVPEWRIAYQYVNNIVDALNLTLDDICYLYVVPFRTAGDKGSAMPEVFTDKGHSLHLSRQLESLRPSLVIAMDRPSQRYLNSWAAGKESLTNVFYFTRKRDAHQERRALLADLKRLAFSV